MTTKTNDEACEDKDTMAMYIFLVKSQLLQKQRTRALEDCKHTSQESKDTNKKLTSNNELPQVYGAQIYGVDNGLLKLSIPALLCEVWDNS